MNFSKWVIFGLNSISFLDIKKLVSSNIKQQDIDPLAFDCDPYEIDDMEEEPNDDVK